MTSKQKGQPTAVHYHVCVGVAAEWY